MPSTWGWIRAISPICDASPFQKREREARYQRHWYDTTVMSRVGANGSADDNDEVATRDGFDVLDLDDGQHVEIRTSVLEEKSTAFDALLAHASTLGAKFGEYIRPTLELALPNLKVSALAMRLNLAKDIPVLLFGERP
jgi:hypothetical protein